MPNLPAKLAAEEDIRHLLDPLERSFQALAYAYLYALNWRIDTAQRVIRETFGD